MLSEEEAGFFLEYVYDLVYLFKARYRDPYIIVAGDWDKADTDIAFQDFPFLQEIQTPHTRG